MARVILAQGQWCNDCEFLEGEEDVQPEGCLSCGCDEGRHTSVEVVACAD